MFPNSRAFLESLECSHDSFPNLYWEINIRQHYILNIEKIQLHHPINLIY